MGRRSLVPGVRGKEEEGRRNKEGMLIAQEEIWRKLKQKDFLGDVERNRCGWEKGTTTKKVG